MQSRYSWCFGGRQARPATQNYQPKPPWGFRTRHIEPKKNQRHFRPNACAYHANATSRCRMSHRLGQPSQGRGFAITIPHEATARHTGNTLRETSSTWQSWANPSLHLIPQHQQTTHLQADEVGAGSAGPGTLGGATSLTRFDAAPAALTSADIHSDLSRGQTHLRWSAAEQYAKPRERPQHEVLFWGRCSAKLATAWKPTRTT